MRSATALRYAAAILTVTLAGAFAARDARAETSYVVPSLSDFSGPFSSVMPALGGARESVIGWWNADVGSKIGVKLVMKAYDTRFDTAQTASLWPGILCHSVSNALAVASPIFIYRL